MCCVLFDGYEYHSTNDHEHKRRQTGKVSASIVIAENAQFHRDHQAFFSNEKKKTNFISLLTTHLRGIGHHVEVMQIHSLYPMRLSSLGMVRPSHWRNDMEHIFIRKESKLLMLRQNDCHQRSVQHIHYHSLRVHLQVVRWTVLIMQ